MRRFGNEADFLLIENIVAAIKNLRTFRARIEQVAHRRNRAIMQIRRAQPDAIERHVRVAVGFSKMAEAPRISGIESVLRRG